MFKTNIYFVLAEDVIGGPRVKIGFSGDVNQRLKDMQIGSPVKLELILSFRAPSSVEAKLHKAFAKYHIHGEWFELSEPIVLMIGQIYRDYGEAVTAKSRWVTAGIDRFDGELPPSLAAVV